MGTVAAVMLSSANPNPNPNTNPDPNRNPNPNPWGMRLCGYVRGNSFEMARYSTKPHSHVAPWPCSHCYRSIPLKWPGILQLSPNLYLLL